jgi:hypothetical protein
LISAVIPYWAPPKDEKNPDGEPKVKGDWKKLLNGVHTINSPITPINNSFYLPLPIIRC